MLFRLLDGDKFNDKSYQTDVSIVYLIQAQDRNPLHMFELPTMFLYSSLGIRILEKKVHDAERTTRYNKINRMKQLCTLAAFLLLTTFGVLSQKNDPRTVPLDSTKTYQLELIDGTEFIGNILSRDSTQLVLSTSSIPRIQLNLASIKKLKVIENEVVFNGSTAQPNPHYTRYFFAPSAFNLKKGEGYYQNTYLVLNSVNYGFTDHFSMGVSIELISTFGTIGTKWTPIYLITPKFGFEVAKNLNVGLGALIAGAGTEGGFQLGYGLITYGTTENNVTLGVSAGFADGEYMRDPPITLGGMFRMGRRTSFVTENWIVPSFGSLYSYGVRFFGSKIAVDLGFLNNKYIVDNLFIGIPYVDFTVKF